MQTIYDFGMHIADDTEVYLKKGFRVIAIEANPSLCDAALAKFGDEVARGDLVIVNQAIGDRKGTFNFYVCNERSIWSTASAEVLEAHSRHGVTFETVPVEFTTADSVLRKYGPARFCKIDIEGHDLVCLRQIARSGVKLDYISFEAGPRMYNEAVSVCRKMGFTRFSLVDQRPIEGSLSPHPSREGKAIKHHFTHGQSGPFGDDLLHCKSAGALLRQYRLLNIQRKMHGLMRRVGLGSLGNRLLPETQTWHDIHAGRQT